MFNALIEKTLEWFYGYGLTGLFLLAFAESSFFPVPPDLLIIGLTLAKPDEWLIFVLIASLGSVLGAGFGYFIGIKIGEPLLEKITSKKTIKKAHYFFEKYGVWAVLISAFTPIPFKVFTILSGILYLDLKKFFVAAIIGRTARFFLVGFTTKLFGKKLYFLIDKYLFMISAIIVFIGIFFVYKKWRNNSNKLQKIKQTKK